MTPLQYAQNLAQSDIRDEVVLGIAMMIRGVTDPDPADPFRAPWPMTIDVARRCAAVIGITNPGHDLLTDALLKAPQVPDYLLNKEVSR